VGSGVDTGVYGTRGVPAPDNVPSARVGAVLILSSMFFIRVHANTRVLSLAFAKKVEPAIGELPRYVRYVSKSRPASPPARTGPVAGGIRSVVRTRANCVSDVRIRGERYELRARRVGIG
jgi:hypothetical protein